MGLITEIMNNVRPARRRGVATLTTAEQIAAVRAALDRLERERAGASDAIATASARRRELLLCDDTDADIEALEADSDRRHRDLERMELVEVDLLRQLGELRNAAHTEEWSQRRSDIEFAARDYLDAARVALGRFNRYIGMLDTAHIAGFDAEVRPYIGLVPALHDGAILAGPLLDAFEAQIERQRESRTVTPTPAAPRSATASPEPPVVEPPVVVPKPERRTPDDFTPLAEGEVRLRIVRAGFQDREGRRCYAGQVIRLPSDLADRALRGGAAEFFDEDELRAAGLV